MSTHGPLILNVGRRRIMNRQLLILCMFTVVLCASCARERHVDIKLQKTHLEKTPAGSWLSDFEVSHASDAESIKMQIVAELKRNGTVVDEYTRGDGVKTVKATLYDYGGKRILEEYYAGGIWNGPKVVPYQEYYNAGWNVWLTIDLGKGVPYSELLPEHHTQINPNRKYEHMATIESEENGRRLFLFGNGNICKRVSLF